MPFHIEQIYFQFWLARRRGAVAEACAHCMLTLAGGRQYLRDAPLEHVQQRLTPFDVEPLRKLVKTVTLEEFAQARAGSEPGAGVALYRVHLEYNPTWSDPRGFELYPALKSLLVDLEYFALISTFLASILTRCCLGAALSICTRTGLLLF